MMDVRRSPACSTGARPTRAWARVGWRWLASARACSRAPAHTISVPIIADGAAEPDESVTVALSAPSNAALGQNSALTLVIDDAESPDDPRVHTVRLPLLRR